MASGSPKSASERREAQREALRQQRQAELRRQRSVRIIIIAVITVIALALLSVAGLFIYRAATADKQPVTMPTGVSEDAPYLSFGAEEGSGAPVVDLNLDFMCPYCGQFDGVNSADIQELVENDQMTLHLTPRRFLDANSTSGDYSTRAANALVCVYEENPDNALAFTTLMYENQPAEGSAGLTDDQILEYAKQAGASDEVSSCMSSKTYWGYVRKAAEPYGADLASSTPYVAIDGTVFEDYYTEGAFKQAVLEAAGSSASDAGGASDGGS
ncbi:DsbA family protein [Brachybacterium sp. NBEC-018]|uniref:DsbA family protein n=1 Tax=Brachybacterium sp. NBEC-018 TaxID=2996004 RepID=UPI002174D288|nr:DsbA family protein [Brachybacterium sp. NBEC-018]UVY83843.1 DsbA family protein [Brachybacterium sp. NBEC-018]